MKYKRPVSVLVVIYAKETKRVLMLKRRDDPDFWQSVTGSLEEDETPLQTALREVREEVGIDIIKENLELVDCHRTIIYEIFAHFRHRYAPEITHGQEHWFVLALPSEREIALTEHTQYLWLDAPLAADLTKSAGNQQAIREFVI
ncbi:dihydroneopterin triphosphate pyrophosphohydrolase [Proteus hauseri ATCC 700826]|uniref:Dihydroneopterin triphosphate pyrophosphohydrolase n=1 Tax=Proteus hauseri ATCC 700826 TaxID=1354271 RepID=A0AAJ3HRR6_PROHU|nr:dihydroneopterin triphosphate diphosphatase [Proteus hauseri]OAT46594.1 dihydroneopterin triphosphate pyrophosphohydrolase [Proteus hauseri ATCC 700826]